MLTHIILILALAAGALVVNGYEQEVRYDYKQETIPSMHVEDISKTIEMVTTKDMHHDKSMVAMLDHANDIMAMKPNGHQCIIVNGIPKEIANQYKAGSEEAKMSKVTDLKEVELHLTKLDDDEAKDMRSKLPAEMIDMCTASSTKKEVKVKDLILTKVEPDGEKRDASFYNWWPWWGWWYWNRCHYCNYYKPYFYYYWPCYRWPYWFYYWRFRLIIMW